MHHRILFVCMGNICRSPAAEGMLRARLRQEAPHGWEQIEIDSAATHAYHVGRAPDARMQQAALARGIDLSACRARLVQPEDFLRFTHVFAMDEANLLHLQTLRPPSATVMPTLFLHPFEDGRPRAVPDPYYGGAQGFERVLDLLEEGCDALIERLRGAMKPA